MSHFIIFLPCSLDLGFGDSTTSDILFDIWSVVAQSSKEIYKGVRQDIARGAISETQIEAAWEKNDKMRHFQFFYPMFTPRASIAPLFPMMISMRGASAEDMLKVMTPADKSSRRRGGLDEGQWAFEDMMRTYFAAIYNSAARPTSKAVLQKLEVMLNEDIFSKLSAEGAFIASYILPATFVFDWRIRPTAAQLVKAFDQYYTTGECNVVGAVKALPTPIEEDANSRAFMDAEDYIDMGDYTFGFIGFAAIAAIVAIIAAVVVIVVVRRRKAAETNLAEEEQC
jgi:heme exporter protein D